MTPITNIRVATQALGAFAFANSGNLLSAPGYPNHLIALNLNVHGHTLDAHHIYHITFTANGNNITLRGMNFSHIDHLHDGTLYHFMGY